MIRGTDQTDYAAVERLWLELNASHTEVEPEFIQTVATYMSPAEYQMVLDDSLQEILVLEADGIEGAVWLVERAHQGGQAIEMPVAFIQEVCVKQSRQRMGHGRALMQAVEDWAIARNLQGIEFNVWAHNVAALSFYENLGFKYARHEMWKKLSADGRQT